MRCSRSAVIEQRGQLGRPDQKRLLGSAGLYWRSRFIMTGENPARHEQDRGCGPRALHEQNWLETKASDAFFEQTPRYKDIADLVIALRPRRLLDVGCGSGYLARLLKAREPGLVVHGVDFAMAAVVRARAYTDQVWLADLDKSGLPCRSQRYDTVTCVEVLEHLYDPDHALREIARVIAPGGHAVVTVPNLAYWRYRLDLLRVRVPPPAADQRHLHQFDRELLSESLARASLRLVKMTGHRLRLRWLACLRPSVFSDMLVAVCSNRP
jgi:2-polyprenyl-3-methyl-5-hydroxy-6-metoxy-1,4-benzoquinol methylase